MFQYTYIPIHLYQSPMRETDVQEEVSACV